MKFIGVTLINIRWSFVLPAQIKCPCINSTQMNQAHIKMSWTDCVLSLLPWAAVSVRAAPPWGLVGGLDGLAGATGSQEVPVLSMRGTSLLEVL